MKKENIILLCWLKNNEKWYYPENKRLLDLNEYENYEVINYYNTKNFLVYAWEGDDKIDGRLFKAEQKA